MRHFKTYLPIADVNIELRKTRRSGAANQIDKAIDLINFALNENHEEDKFIQALEILEGLTLKLRDGAFWKE